MLKPATPATPPSSLVSPLEHFKSQRQEAFDSFLRDGRIQTLWRSLTQATDALVQHIAADTLTLLAVGGYGRCELFPFSDVDLLVLVEDEKDGVQASKIIATLQQLWDMQIPVSHAVRTVEETIAAAAADHTIATGLMDARLLCGSRSAFLRLKRRFSREVRGVHARAYVEAKLKERDARHKKWGDSRFVLEPHVKEGKGALRDLQTLNWLARYCYGLTRASQLVREDLLTREEWQHYRHAYEFFSGVRARLHILRGRADERLSFDAQLKIAADMHFPGRTPQNKAEALMRRYFQFARQVGNLTRMFCAILEEENLRIPVAPFAASAPDLPDYLTLTAGRLHFAAGADLTSEPARMVALFAFSQHLRLDIHPRAQLALARLLTMHGHHLPTNGAANATFLAILLHQRPGDLTLRHMNETGVLSALIPEFAGIGGQMQYDGYHTYTVDEHTLMAVANLAAVESGQWSKELPLASQLAHDITDRAPLYVAMLLHDIAKGKGGGHAEKGWETTYRIARRLGLSDGQAELAAWLVRHHLLLTDVAFKRDLEDSKTIADFVHLVQSPERLRLLVLVTVADVMAVGPTIWNPWKGSLIRELYRRAMAAMGVSAQEETPHDDTTHPAYRAWQQHGSVGLHVVHDESRSVTEVSCCVRYQRQLFRLLCGVMAWMSANIVSARVRLLPEGLALVILDIQNLKGASFAEEKRKLAQLPELIDAALAGALNFADELPQRRRIHAEPAVSIAPTVYMDNEVSARASVIEVNARDRLGLLYDILSALEACGLQVMTAHIATYGAKAVDVFYVKDAFGLKVYHWNKLAQVQDTVLAALHQHS